LTEGGKQNILYSIQGVLELEPEHTHSFRGGEEQAVGDSVTVWNLENYKSDGREQTALHSQLDHQVFSS
jgi:hypothetical protein